MGSESRGNPASASWVRREGVARIGTVALAVIGAVTLGGAAALGAGALTLAAAAIGCVAAFIIARQRREISALRDVRRSLAASDREARERYENIPAGVLAIGADGRALAANRALVALLGFPSESELLARDLRDEIYAGPGTLDALLQRTRVNGELSSTEMTLRRRDGIPVMLAATVRTYWDEAGGVARFEATVLDIGELKVADRQRRSLERRFRHLFDSDAVGFMFGNLRRASLDEANQYLRELLGVRESQLPIHLDALVASGEPTLTDAIGAALESGGHTAPTERTYLRSDGRRVGVLMCVSIVDPLLGDFIAVVIERDTSGARSTAIDTATGFHESVLDALPGLVARFGTGGGLTYCNRAFREWFGFPTSPLGWSLEALLGPGTQPQLNRAIEQVQAGKGERLSVDLRRADGRLRRFAATLSAHGRSDGSVAGFVTVLTEEESSYAVATPIPGYR